MSCSHTLLVHVSIHMHMFVPMFTHIDAVVYPYLVWCCLLTTGSAVHCCGGRSTDCLACRVWSTSGSCTVLSS